MADAIDDDTCQAVLALWATDTKDLPSLFEHPPRTGRLKSPEPLPYATVNSEFRRADHGYSYKKDVRKVTITLRGTRQQAVQGLTFALALFNRDLGGPEKPRLEYPSGARLVKWWPVNSGELKQEETTKDGLDVWAATIEAEVTSVRAP